MNDTAYLGGPFYVDSLSCPLDAKTLHVRMAAWTLIQLACLMHRAFPLFPETVAILCQSLKPIHPINFKKCRLRLRAARRKGMRLWALAILRKALNCQIRATRFGTAMLAVVAFGCAQLRP